MGKAEMGWVNLNRDEMDGYILIGMGKVQTGWVNLHSEKFSSNEMGKSRYGLVKPKCEGEISIGIGKSQMGCTSMYTAQKRWDELK